MKTSAKSEAITFLGEEELLRSRGVELAVVHDQPVSI
jgi:hypothetical protein